MNNINFDEMSIEDINYFKNRYLKVMMSLRARTDEILGIIDEMMPENARFNNVELTLKGKLLFLAKKLAINTGLTFFTGINPMYLDSGAEVFSRKGRYQKYQKTDPLSLSRSATLDLQRGLDKAIEMLNTMDEAVLRDNLKKFDEGYNQMAKEGIKSDLPCYAITLSVFLINNLKILDLSTFDKIDVLYKRNMSLELTENFYLEFDNIYKEYESNKAKKM